MTIRLTAGGWEAHLLPARGGAFGALRLDGRDVLRPLPEDAPIIDAACIPLVPYPNRIAYGRFAFAGEAVSLPRNFGDHPHALHGVGWRRAWQVAEAAPDRALLLLDHAPDADWPWRFTARQRIALSAEGLSAELELVNGDARPMPAGLGFHPYFATDASTTLRFTAREVWLTGDEPLPEAKVPIDQLVDWPQGAPAAQPRLIDHCHTGWDGEVCVERADGRFCLTATGTPFLHIFSPPGLGFIGVEPVSHMPDALNRPEPAAETGLRVLAPGEAMQITMRIAAAG